MANMKDIKKAITIPNRIFLKGFDTSTKEEDLKNIFLRYGAIVEANIIKDSFTGHSKGFGFITFDSQQVTEHVLATCKTVELGGNEITVGPAKIKRHLPKFFQHHYYGNSGAYNRPLPNGGFCPVSYTISPNGLFTFYPTPQMPVIPTSPVQPFAKYPFVDSIAESEMMPILPSATIEASCMETLPEPTYILNGNSVHHAKSPPMSNHNHDISPSTSSGETHFIAAPAQPTQQMSGYYSNGHIENINNHFVNINGHHIATTSAAFRSSPPMNITPTSQISHSTCEVPHTSLDMGSIANNLPASSSMSYLPISKVHYPERRTLIESPPKMKLDGRLNMIPESSKPVSSVLASSSMMNEMTGKQLKNQKYIFMHTTPSKVNRVLVQSG